MLNTAASDWERGMGARSDGPGREEVRVWERSHPRTQREGPKCVSHVSPSVTPFTPLCDGLHGSAPKRG